MTAIQVRIEKKIIEEIKAQYNIKNPDLVLMHLNDKHYIEAALLCHLGYEIEINNTKKGLTICRKKEIYRT